MAGCAITDKIRGTYSVAGGLREHRWTCNGPSAAFMIVADQDTSNPVGPLSSLDVAEDTYGSAPARDELLVRNGCVGKATAPYDPKYPACVKYTGCPAAYPVVWCDFPTGTARQPELQQRQLHERHNAVLDGSTSGSVIRAPRVHAKKQKLLGVTLGASVMSKSAS